MKSYKQFVSEAKTKFTNWVMPSDRDIALEYKIEYTIKPLKKMTGDAFPTVEDFIKAVKSAKIVDLSPSFDRKVQNRSRTKSKEQIMNLIKGYASYPEFRNEKSVTAIYQAFADNKAMKMPFVLKFPNGDMRIMAGNTRADIAIQMNIIPKAVLIEVPAKK